MPDETRVPEEATTVVTSVTPDAGTARLLAGEFTRWSMRRPAMVVWEAVVGLIALASLVGAAVGRDTGLALTFVVWVVVALLVPTMLFWSTRRGMTFAYPPGTPVTLTVDDDGIGFETASGSQWLRYSALRWLVVTDYAVLLRIRDRRITMLAPRVLFDPEVVDRVRAGIASAASSS